MDIGKAIYKILNDNIAVESMVGTRIAPNVMKQTSPFPFIVYDVSSDSPEGQKDSVALLDNASIMVSAYCKTYSEASKLANYIRTALDRVNGVFNAVNIQAIDFDGYDDVFDDMSGSDGVYRKSLNFNIRIINSFNNIYSTHFDGVDDYVDLGVSGLSSIKNTGSISAWFKLETISSSGNIFQTRVDSNNNILLYYNAGNNELTSTYKGGGTANITVTDDNIEGDGLWHNVISTWDSSGTEGPEQITNGDFDTDYDWTKGAGWTISGGAASHTGGASYLSQDALQVDTLYKVSIIITAVSGGFVQIYMGNSPASVLISAIGNYTYYFTSQSSVFLGFALRSLGDITIDNVSVKEYTGGTINLYLDGTLKDTTVISTNITGSFSTASIGSNSIGGGFWKGNIDEVVIFNKELDQSEVTNLYNNGLPFNPKPLANMKGYWKMGDGGIVGNPIATYPTIVDETGNNNGTMTNMTSTDFQADVPE